MPKRILGVSLQWLQTTVIPLSQSLLKKRVGFSGPRYALVMIPSITNYPVPLPLHRPLKTPLVQTIREGMYLPAFSTGFEFQYSLALPLRWFLLLWVFLPGRLWGI